MSQFNKTYQALNQTQHLDVNHAPQMPDRHTHPLDLDTPHKLRLILPDMTAVLEVPLRSYMVVGRKHSLQDSQVDIDLSPFDAVKYGVSRYHAIISNINHRISVKDFNSTNGTLLNGFALAPMHAYRLRHGDELMLGQLCLKVHFVGVKAAEGV